MNPARLLAPLVGLPRDCSGAGDWCGYGARLPEALPLGRGTFDVGVGGLVLCTIPHPGRALAEVRRVLKRGASLRLLEHVRMPNRWVARMQATLTPIWMRVSRGCRLDRNAVEIVTRAGFALESVVSHAGRYVVEIVGRPLPAQD